MSDRLGFANGGTIRAAGLELESEIRLKRGAQALASYALQEATDAASGGQRLTNSPRHMAKLRLSVPGPLARSFASFEWQYLSTRTTLAGTTVDPASVANVTVNLPIGRSVTVTGTDSQSVRRPLCRPCLGRAPGRFDRTERADLSSRIAMEVLDSVIGRARNRRPPRSRHHARRAPHCHSPGRRGCAIAGCADDGLDE